MKMDKGFILAIDVSVTRRICLSWLWSRNKETTANINGLTPPKLTRSIKCTNQNQAAESTYTEFIQGQQHTSRLHLGNVT